MEDHGEVINIRDFLRRNLSAIRTFKRQISRYALGKEQSESLRELSIHFVQGTQDVENLDGFFARSDTEETFALLFLVNGIFHGHHKFVFRERARKIKSALQRRIVQKFLERCRVENGSGKYKDTATLIFGLWATHIPRKDFRRWGLQT